MTVTRNAVTSGAGISGRTGSARSSWTRRIYAPLLPMSASIRCAPDWCNARKTGNGQAFAPTCGVWMTGLPRLDLCTRGSTISRIFSIETMAMKILRRCEKVKSSADPSAAIPSWHRLKRASAEPCAAKNEARGKRMMSFGYCHNNIRAKLNEIRILVEQPRKIDAVRHSRRRIT